MTTPQIVEKYTDIGTDVGRIVRRILSHLPPDVLDGLREVRILDRNTEHPAFGCYRSGEGSIELYVADIIGWLPFFLRKSYLVPYVFVGVTLGHELDHHAQRANRAVDRELSAERSAFKYVYPSLGIFKPLAWTVVAVARPLRALKRWCSSKRKSG